MSNSIAISALGGSAHKPGRDKIFGRYKLNPFIICEANPGSCAFSVGSLHKPQEHTPPSPLFLQFSLLGPGNVLSAYLEPFPLPFLPYHPGIQLLTACDIFHGSVPTLSLFMFI
jgi:hypothetical protein